MHSSALARTPHPVPGLHPSEVFHSDVSIALIEQFRSRSGKNLSAGSHGTGLLNASVCAMECMDAQRRLR